jgi:hypothetical protein
MFMRVSSLLSPPVARPDGQEAKETDAIDTWFRVAAYLLDALEGLPGIAIHDR